MAPTRKPEEPYFDDYFNSWTRLNQYVGKKVLMVLGLGGHCDGMIEGNLVKVTPPLWFFQSF
jgi:hypothetical protein